MQDNISFIKEIKKADLDVCRNAGNFLQSAMWGEFKSCFGWNALSFLVDLRFNDKNETAALLLLSRRLVRGFTFAYVPWGPLLPEDFPAESRAACLSELAAKLKPFLAHNTVFIRFDPPWYAIDSDKKEEGGENETALFFRFGFKRAAATVQPPDTVIINLGPSCDEILSSMKPKWRYNISLAGKKGVQVKESGAQDIKIFYKLLKETAQRDGIAVHKIEYYKKLFEICDDHGNNCRIRLYTASHEGDDLAAIVVLFFGETATYLYGASSNIKRNLMPPYALQWSAMRDAREMGCHYYDLFGIPPDEDPNHPMAGLFRFKTGFGGLIIHRPASMDYIYRKTIYSLFNFAESLRKKLRDRKKGQAAKSRSIG
ncbi:MAG: peptidoglycan bridge formation glycyltransferase FemA/FemB family protein [Treponema sp.]|jgi:lipid II:glycine glycyltransferase (peptidoglycan interpeptide bridge formation enzyme)|nr:peptidoglycan bridge formation glycyltransferase FemA/FemB family protein [Treponema sp.]